MSTDEVARREREWFEIDKHDDPRGGMWLVFWCVAVFVVMVLAGLGALLGWFL